MKNKCMVIILFLLLIILVVTGSFISVNIWSAKSEKLVIPEILVINDSMTLIEIGEINSIDNKVLKSVFNLKGNEDLNKYFLEFGISKTDAILKINQAIAISSENESKNWGKIKLKFILWFITLIIAFILLKSGKIKSNLRNLMYLSIVIIFGVILGADPGPMGTLKDTIVLFGQYKVFFPPRVIALVIMLLGIVIANKFICSWGCQVGTLQDLIFRLNRNKNQLPIIKQYRISFLVSNTVRIIFFIVFTLIAVFWVFDIIEPIDPFKIFKPDVLGIMGILFVSAILILSLFVYRPWCHIFCPFGLAGWIVEKISIFRIKVDYDKCIACGKCEKACPSSVMGAILRRDKVIPDCFSCGSCIESCPTGAISFSVGKRDYPPKGKFDKLN